MRFYQKGFTLIELVVSIAASSVVIGGFLLTFANLNKTTKLVDNEVKNVAIANNVRLMIHKLIAGASYVDFRTVSYGGKSLDVLFYYKWEKNAANVEILSEYGYFFTDEPQASEAAYELTLNTSTGNYDQLRKNLYFNRVTDTGLTAAPPPEAFDYNDPNRFVVMDGVVNFYASIEQLDTRVTATEAVSEEFQRYSVDYQITAQIAEPEINSSRNTIFKGNTYGMGRLTGS